MELSIVNIAFAVALFAAAAIFGSNTIYCHIFEREDIKRWEEILKVANEFEYDGSEVFQNYSVDYFTRGIFVACLWDDGTVDILYDDMHNVYVCGYYRKASNKMRRVLEKQIYQQEQNGEV